MQRQNVDGLGQRAAQAGDDVVDLARPGQEDEGVPGPLAQGPLGGGGDVGEELARHPVRAQARDGGRRRRPVLGDRMEGAGDVEDRGGGAGGAEEVGQAGQVGGRGHGDQPQVLAQGAAGVEEEGQEEVGVEGALVDLVEDDGGRAAQLGVVLEAAQEEAGGDDLDAGVAADDALAPHGVSDGAPHRFAQERREAAGGGPGGHAPRLGDDDAAGPTGAAGREAGDDVGDERRDQRGLAGAGRSGDDDSARRNAGQQFAESGEGFPGGQRRRGGE